MKKETIYQVVITPEGEHHYLDELENIYRSHSIDSADRKSSELLEKALSLQL